MSVRKIRLIGARPGRGEPALVEFSIGLEYLRGEPVVSVEITETEALEQAERLLSVVNIIRRNRGER